jgi:CHAT domain-containing protein/tetratricopeptide (TPR) repeat protein
VRTLAPLVVVSALAAPAAANDLPRATPAGSKALLDLVDACVASGGLRATKPAGGGGPSYSVGDPGKLRAAVAARGGDLTPALRDALVALVADLDGPPLAGPLALLEAVAAESGDARTRGFAAFFRALDDRDARRAPAALKGFAEAARRFADAGDRPWEATAHNERGSLLSATGAPAGAVAEHRRALALREDALGPDHPLTAVSHNNLGAAYHRLGRFADALAEHEAALRTRRTAPGVLPRVIAHSLVQVGMAKLQTSDPAGARAAFEEALSLLKPPADRALIADALGGLGGAAEALGDYDLSLQYARRTGDLLLELYGDPRHPAVVNATNNLGSAHARRGDYHAARVLHEVALRFRRERAAGRDDADTATSLDNLAVVCLRLGDLAAAESYAAEALAVRRRLFPGDNPAVARTLNNLAGVKEKRGGHAASRALYREALGMWRAVHAGRPHVDVAICLDNLAGVAFRAGDVREAERYAREAAAEFRRLFGDAHPEYAVALGNRARYLHLRGDPAAARPLLDQAVAALAARPGPLPPAGKLSADDLRPLPQTVHLLHLRGQAAEAVGADRDAAADYALAAAVLERVRRDNLGSAASRLDTGEETHALFVRLVGVRGRLYERDGDAVHLGAALAAAEQGTARLFLESLGRSRAHDLGGVPEGLRRREAELQARRAALERQVGDGPTTLTEEDRRLRAEEEELTRTLEREYPAYAAWTRPKPCTPAEAREALGPGEVAVFFLPGEPASYAVAVDGRPAAGDRGDGLAVVPLPPSAELAARVATITDPETLRLDGACRDLGRELYELLLAPLGDRLAGKDLVVVAGGPLGQLPFELLVGPDGRYLVEGRRVRYAPSLTALRLLRKWDRVRPRPDRPLWAAADPIYSASDTRAGGSKLSPASASALAEYQARLGPAAVPLPRLRASAAEAEAVRSRLGAAARDVLVGAAATEAAVKAASRRGELARCRFVHLATHGFLGAGRGRQPALVLSLVGNGGGDDEGGADDGFLQLDEVTRLRLNADLVTLSACETGRGQVYDAEGVVGLARAFLYAGSRGVVCSLWSVDDTATAGLMADLYGGLTADRPAATALREAKRRMIKDGQPPFFWAPFVLIGE